MINIGSALDKANEVISDTAITAKIKSKYIMDDQLGAFGLHVVTENGNVILSGFLDDEVQVERAIKLAKEVEGVKQVKYEVS